MASAPYREAPPRARRCAICGRELHEADTGVWCEGCTWRRGVLRAAALEEENAATLPEDRWDPATRRLLGALAVVFGPLVSWVLFQVAWSNVDVGFIASCELCAPTLIGISTAIALARRRGARVRTFVILALLSLVICTGFPYVFALWVMFHMGPG